MAKGRKPTSSNDFTEIKQFSSVQEIDTAVQKLNRRIEEVRMLQRDRVAYDDQRVKNAEENIRKTVLEVYGPNSPEYGHIHQSWWGMFVQEFGHSAVPQTVTLLEGLVKGLEEKRLDFAGDLGPRAKAAFEGLDLHPRIAVVSANLYRDRHYRQAVLDASIALVDYVKDKSGRRNIDGAPLMSTVFSPNAPVLAFNALADQTDKDEQQGMMHLFMGAVLALRNPRAHSVFDDYPELALDAIAFPSMLAKRLDGTRRV